MLICLNCFSLSSSSSSSSTVQFSFISLSLFLFCFRISSIISHLNFSHLTFYTYFPFALLLLLLLLLYFSMPSYPLRFEVLVIPSLLQVDWSVSSSRRQWPTTQSHMPLSLPVVILTPPSPNPLFSQPPPELRAWSRATSLAPPTSSPLAATPVAMAAM